MGEEHPSETRVSSEVEEKRCSPPEKRTKSFAGNDVAGSTDFTIPRFLPGYYSLFEFFNNLVCNGFIQIEFCFGFSVGRFFVTHSSPSARKFDSIREIRGEAVMA